MPELTTVSPTPAPETVIETVTETVEVFPALVSPAAEPPAPPADAVPVPPPGPAIDEAVVTDLINGINGLNTALEGDQTTGVAGPLVLDDVQFGVIVLALAMLIALAAALFIAGLRR